MPHEKESKGTESLPETPAFDDDAMLLPLIIFTAIYGCVFSLFALFMNVSDPKYASPIIVQITTDLVSRINTYVSVGQTILLPMGLPPIIYYIPPVIYLAMNILLFLLLKPHKSTAAKTLRAWIPTVAMLLILGVCALAGMTIWEEIVIVVPLTMSFLILPWYLCVYRTRILGSKGSQSEKS